MKQGTYEVRHGHVLRTEFSIARAEIRKVWRTPERPLTIDPQDRADEKWLSRSREYPNKGVNERRRRVWQQCWNRYR